MTHTVKQLQFTTIKSIDVQDLDEIVQEVYGRPYSFQQQDGCKERGVEYVIVPDEYADDYGNDTFPEEVNGMGVSFAGWLARDPKQPIPGQEYDFQLRLFWQRSFYPAVGMIFNDLHARGHIPAGEYEIVIDW